MNECRGLRLVPALTISLALHAVLWWLQPVQPPTLSTAGSALQIRLLSAAPPETAPAPSPTDDPATDAKPADAAPRAPAPRSRPEPPVESAIETASPSRRVVEPEPPGRSASRPESRQPAQAAQAVAPVRPEPQPQRRPSSGPSAPAPPARSEPQPQHRPNSGPSAPAPPARSEPVPQIRPSRQARSTDSATDPAGAQPADSVDEPAPAKVLANPKPDYPRQARRRGLEGQVLLEVEVRADGRPGRIDVVASSGHAILDRAALEGLRRWRFQPARNGGRAVDATLRVPVSFRLN